MKYEDIEIGDRVRLRDPEFGTEAVLTVEGTYEVYEGAGSYSVCDHRGHPFYSEDFSEVELIDRPVKLPNKQGAIVGHKEFPGAFMTYVLTGYGSWVALDSEGQTHSRAQDVVQGSLKSGDWEVKFEGFGGELNND